MLHLKSIAFLSEEERPQKLRERGYGQLLERARFARGGVG